MKRYRVLEVIELGAFIVQRRRFWIWWDIASFLSKEEAEFRILILK